MARAKESRRGQETGNEPVVKADVLLKALAGAPVEAMASRKQGVRKPKDASTVRRRLTSGSSGERRLGRKILAYGRHLNGPRDGHVTAKSA